MKTMKLERAKPKKIYAPNKKVRVGVYVVAVFLVILYLLPIYVMLNQPFAK